MDSNPVVPLQDCVSLIAIWGGFVIACDVKRRALGFSDAGTAGRGQNGIRTKIVPRS